MSYINKEMWNPFKGTYNLDPNKDRYQQIPFLHSRLMSVCKKQTQVNEKEAQQLSMKLTKKIIEAPIDQELKPKEMEERANLRRVIAYSKLIDVCRSQVGNDEEKALRLTENIGRLPTQALSVDITAKIVKKYPSPDSYVKGDETHYDISFIKDKVVLTMKTFYEVNSVDSKFNIIPYKYISCKRTVEIPVSDLLEKDLENSQNPLPGLKTKDKMSTSSHKPTEEQFMAF